jgi:hypothetical protein
MEIVVREARNRNDTGEETRGTHLFNDSFPVHIMQSEEVISNLNAGDTFAA